MTQALLGLGSNMGDRRSRLELAVSSLPEVVRVSGLYETAPIGGPEQDPFLNLVVEVDTSLGPWLLLQRCHALERAADRVRVVRWGPRTLDIDILLYGNLELNDPDLTIPHPRMWNRKFVLQPLADLVPEQVSAARLLAVDDQEVIRVEDLAGWPGGGRRI
jgi:2-amino-4-hydroxy-6-hydroxymethyldihydropteridine diphosphokinase